MICKIKAAFFTIIVLVLFFLRTNAQIRIFYKNSLNTIKDGNTHVVVNDFDFPDVIKFYNVFKKNWAITKSIDFIKKDSLRKNLKIGDSYFSIENYLQKDKNGNNSTFFYLNYWVPAAAALKKKGNVKIGDEIAIAQIPLSADTMLLKSLKTKGFVYPKFDFDGAGFFANWNPWVLKNYLRELSNDLQSDKQSDLTDNVDNIDELKLLKNDVLYCTEDNLFCPEYLKDKSAYIKKLFTDFKYNFKIIRNQDLEEKIMVDFEPVYYLLFFHNTTAGKVIAIINSHSGEPVYMNHKPSKSFYLKPEDLKDISGTMLNAK